MDTQPPRIICIGLANVDVIANVSDEFLTAYGMIKSASNILDACTTGTLLARLENPTCHPGGCAANTACGIAEFGVPVQYIGRTGDDGYADIFRSGFAQTKVRFDTSPYPQKITSVCITLVTPDKDRTFAFCTDTAGWFIAPDDLPEANAGTSIYLESNIGLMRAGGNRSLLEEAAIRYQNIPMIVNLNDLTVVNACRPVIGSLLGRDAMTCLIGNIAEVNALFQTDDFDTVCDRVWSSGKIFAITNGSDGAYILKDRNIHHVAADKVPPMRIVNTVGAGDQFAAGFLAGLVADMDLEAACTQGIRAATSVIQQIDARPKHRRIA